MNSPPGTLQAVATAAREARWGGAALALGSALFMGGIVLGLRAFSGDWDTSVGATLPDTAALIQERWGSFQAIWSAELLGALLLASGALLLQRRPEAGPRWVPTAVVWVVGSVLVAVAQALTLGSYPPALAAFSEEPAVFAALRGGVLGLHSTGSVLQLLGLLAALAIELRWGGRGVPDRLVHGGAGVAVLGILAAVGGLIPGVYGAAAVFAAGALLGLSIWARAGRAAPLVRAPGGGLPPAGPGLSR
jgi:hypothetical protein